MSFQAHYCLYEIISLDEFMIIGRILENEKKVKFNANIHCNNCGIIVPGGLQTGESYFDTDEFKSQLKEFKRNYLCGVCRDKKRVDK